VKGVAALGSGVLAAMLVGLVSGVVRNGPSGRTRTIIRGGRQTWLRQAGLDVTPRQFWLVSVGAGLVAFVLLLAVSGLPAVAFVPSLLIGFLPRLYYAKVRSQRLIEVQRAWPDGLRDLIASLSAGMSLTRALEEMTLTGPTPLRDAFSQFPALARTVGTGPALTAIGEQLTDPTSDRVIAVLSLAHERGGAVVLEILRGLAEATTKDIWALEEIQTASLEHKINARVVFVLPWLVLIAMTLRDGAFRSFYRSSAGLAVVFLGGVMSLGGMWIAGRLGRQPDEPRVLGVGK